jgi:excisionase family DNA binding protein
MTTKYVSTSELAEHLGIAHTTVLAMLKSGEIPQGMYLRAGRVFRFDLKAIEEHLLTNATPPRDDEGSSTKGVTHGQLELDLYNNTEENPE